MKTIYLYYCLVVSLILGVFIFQSYQNTEKLLIIEHKLDNINKITAKHTENIHIIEKNSKLLKKYAIKKAEIVKQKSIKLVESTSEKICSYWDIYTQAYIKIHCQSDRRLNNGSIETQ